MECKQPLAFNGSWRVAGGCRCWGNGVQDVAPCCVAHGWRVQVLGVCRLTGGWSQAFVDQQVVWWVVWVVHLCGALGASQVAWQVVWICVCEAPRLPGEQGCAPQEVF
jgi:hypothetical protein